VKLLGVIGVIVLVLMSFRAKADDVKFADDKSCVAWKTRKTLFLFKHVEPVGMNCAVQSIVLNKGSELRLRSVIPINKFDSGEPSRDKEVFNILGGDRQTEIIYTSGPVDEAAIKNMLAAPADMLGLIYVNSKAFPVHFLVSAKTVEGGVAFDGHCTTKFSDLEIPKIKVAGGLIASVDDYLELHFHLLSSQIEKFPPALIQGL